MMQGVLMQGVLMQGLGDPCQRRRGGGCIALTGGFQCKGLLGGVD